MQRDQQHAADEYQRVQHAWALRAAAQKLVQPGQVDHEGDGVDRGQVAGHQHGLPVFLQSACDLDGRVVLVDGETGRDNGLGQQRDDEDDPRSPRTPIPHTRSRHRHHPSILSGRRAEKRCSASRPFAGLRQSSCFRVNWAVRLERPFGAFLSSKASVCDGAAVRRVGQLGLRVGRGVMGSPRT